MAAGSGKVALSVRNAVPGRCAASDRKVNPSSTAVPAAVLIDTLPLAPEPTTATTVAESKTVAERAATPPKRTVTLPEKRVPLMSTACPACAVPGKKEVMVGAGLGVKVNPPSMAVPPGVATDTLPVAPTPTTAVIRVAEFTTNEAAAVPPKRTDVAPVKFVPVI